MLACLFALPFPAPAHPPLPPFTTPPPPPKQLTVWRVVSSSCQSCGGRATLLPLLQQQVLAVVTSSAGSLPLCLLLRRQAPTLSQAVWGHCASHWWLHAHSRHSGWACRLGCSACGSGCCFVAVVVVAAFAAGYKDCCVCWMFGDVATCMNVATRLHGRRLPAAHSYIDARASA